MTARVGVAVPTRERARHRRPWWALLAALLVTVASLAGATGPGAEAAPGAPVPATRGGAGGRTQITGGDVHACALTAAGGIRCWGGNAWGALGDGTTTDRWTPTDVVGLGDDAKSVDAGWNTTCAVTAGGRAKCWGYNLRGQLGDGTTTDRWTPTDVVGLGSGVRAVSAGVFHACALLDGGAVKCWGLNHRGQLGDGTTTDSATPVDVVGLGSGVRAISAGIWHTCAVTAAGGVTCWGQNNFGQLGDGTTTDRWTPTDVAGLGSGVAMVEAATGGDGFADGSHTCAVTTRGGVKCWGINNVGQIGDGTTTDRWTPTDVPGLTAGVRSVSTGGGYSCAVTHAGGVACWGINGFGQLGDGSTSVQPAPVGVTGLTSRIAEVATAGFHTCALSRRGAVTCWGGNFFGQVGDGTTTNRPAPVDVSGSFRRPECPTLIAARHTRFSLSRGYAVLSRATFTADSGYALVGAASLRCLPDRTWSGPVPTAVGTGVVTVTPGTGLVDGQTVSVALSGFPASGSVAWCQGVLTGGPASQGNCGGPIRQGSTDAAGAHTDPAYPVARMIYVAALGRVVDCADPAEACVIGAADIGDIPGSAVASAPLGFAPAG
ncbi:MAG TPA: hypothetical protein VFI47_22035 [Acidimicrobiales bacterium]|nr:hypothetical protein [Acidimicrobiales bacterium]